mgnify:CR=1 FL=1
MNNRISNRDITTREIEELLEQRQSKIKGMESITKSSREKLAKINKEMNEQEKQLVELITGMAQSQQDVEGLDEFNQLNDPDFTEKLKEITDNMRKNRLSLADIIRKG